LAGSRILESPQTALDYEIAQEKASTLGRLGRRLEEAIVALQKFDARAAAPATIPEERATRRALVAEAGLALWHFVVQREALGLRDAAHVLRDYRVPNEVRDRMGALPASPPPRGRD
jgi:hypothetical protein